MYGEEKETYYHRAVLVCMAKKKKPIGCLVGAGNVTGSRPVSGVTDGVVVNSIYYYTPLP